jgi:predicted permease
VLRYPPYMTERPMMLLYAVPKTSTRQRRVKHVLALMFGIPAVLFGLMLVWMAIVAFERSVAEPTTADKLLFRHGALRFAICGSLLLVPGVWYTRVGYYGENRVSRSPGG